MPCTLEAFQCKFRKNVRDVGSGAILGVVPRDVELRRSSGGVACVGGTASLPLVRSATHCSRPPVDTAAGSYGGVAEVAADISERLERALATLV